MDIERDGLVPWYHPAFPPTGGLIRALPFDLAQGDTRCTVFTVVPPSALISKKDFDCCDSSRPEFGTHDAFVKL